MSMHAAITGWGMSVPSKVVTNEDLSKIVDTSDEWIVSRTGIRERHIVSDGETTSTLAAAAGRTAMQMAGLTSDDIDMVIVATFCPACNCLSGASPTRPHPCRCLRYCSCL